MSSKMWYLGPQVHSGARHREIPTQNPLFLYQRPPTALLYYTEAPSLGVASSTFSGLSQGGLGAAQLGTSPLPGQTQAASRPWSHRQANFIHCGWHEQADGRGVVCFPRESMFEVLTIFKAGAKNITATAHGDHHTVSSCHHGHQPKLLPLADT